MNITYKHWMICLLGFICGVSCESYSADMKQTTLSNRNEENTYSISFRVFLDQETEQLISDGLALGITIREIESGIITQRAWLDYFVQHDDETLRASDVETMSSMTLQSINELSLTSGKYEFSLYLKRGKQNLVEHVDTPHEKTCPFPFSQRSPFSIFDVDPSIGSWQGAISKDQEIEINLLSQTCGPGDSNTRLQGLIDLPSNLSESALKRLILHLRPATENQRDGQQNIPVSFPLIPYLHPIESEIGSYSFSMSQLPDGVFSSFIFVDSDGDSLPTPCNIEQGSGGDRWIAETSESQIQIDRGENSSFATRWTLTQVEQCILLRQDSTRQDSTRQDSTETPFEPPFEESNNEKKSIFLGQVDLTDELLTALALSPTQRLWLSTQRRALPPYRFIRAQEIFSLSQALIAEGRFSVHLTQEALNENQELAIWVDEGGDRALTPCDDPANQGADIWLWEGTSDQLSLLLDFDLAQPPPLIPLNISQRCELPDSLIELTFEFMFSWPEDTSTRPLILVYEDLTTGEKKEQVITDLNASSLEVESNLSTPTQLRLSPSTYLFSAYIDHDLNHTFIPCDDQILGDRLSTQSVQVVQTRSGEVTHLKLALSARECPRRATQVDVQMTSTLENQPIASNQLSAMQAIELNQGIEVRCAPQAISLLVSDLDPLNDQGSQLPIYQYCLFAEDQFHVIDALAAGAYAVSACAVMSEQAINQTLTALSTGDISNTWGECGTPQYWQGKMDLIILLNEPEPVELRLTPRCACD